MSTEIQLDAFNSLPFCLLSAVADSTTSDGLFKFSELLVREIEKGVQQCLESHGIQVSIRLKREENNVTPFNPDLNKFFARVVLKKEKN